MSYSDPPPPPPPGVAQPMYGGAAMPTGNNKKAIWSLVLGIVGLCCCGFFTGIPAIILSNQAKTEISSTGQSGGGMATAGLVLGILSIVSGIVGIILVATGNANFNFSTS